MSTYAAIVERLRADDGPATIAECIGEIAAEFRRRYPDAPPGAALGAAHALVGRAILTVVETDPEPEEPRWLN
jgi:hypothetical protein